MRSPAVFAAAAAAATALLVGSANGFSLTVTSVSPCPTALFATGTGTSDRRTFATSTLATALTTFIAVSTGAAPSAQATEKWVYDNAKEVVVVSNYRPKFDDLNQLYGLGRSLDKLNDKVSDPSKWDDALAGLRAFNKDKNFYTGYAKNFMTKIVKRGAADDGRIAYIREASALISSLEGLLRGEERGLSGDAAAKEASSRVKKAQGLVAKFLGESGVEDDRVKEFVAAH